MREKPGLAGLFAYLHNSHARACRSGFCKRPYHPKISLRPGRDGPSQPESDGVAKT
jgi:hypothetical protein